MPQTIEVPGMGQVEFPDGMTDDQIASAIKANMPASGGEGGGAAFGVFAPGRRKPQNNTTNASDAIVMGGARGVKDVIDTGAQALASGYDKLAGGAEGDRVRAMNAEGKQAFSDEYGGNPLASASRVGGNVVATLPIGGALGTAVKATSAAPVVQALGNAIASGGLRTGPGLGTAANLATRAVGGAVSGGATAAAVDPSQAATGALAGAALPVGAKVLGTGARILGRTAKAAIEPFTASGQQAIAGRVLGQAAGDNAAEIAQRLGAAGPLVPGSLPTAGQVAESGGIAALERAVAASNPEPFAARAMEQASARTQALRSIAQDDTARAAAVAAREATTSPLYAQATRANYTVDPALERLLQTPAMQQALKKAEELAANNQRAFSFDVPNTDHFAGLANRTSSASRQITGQGLQDLKMAVDTMLADPASGYAGAAGNSVKALRGQLLNWMESANPQFKAARSTYADMSKPIGQMDVGQELLTRLEPALNDYGGLASETGATYARAMRNADQTAVKATKFKGSDMSDLMTPEQMESLGSIAKDLARKTNAQNLGRGPGSDTAQKLAMQNLAANNIAEQSGYPRVMRALPAAAGAVAGAALGGGVGAAGGGLLGAGIGKGVQALYGGQNAQIQSLIAQALLDPALASNMMTKAAPGASQGALGGRLRQAVTSDQAQMLAELFAKTAPIALSR